MSQAMGTAWDGRAAMSVAAPDMLGRIALAVALVLCCLPYLVFGPIAAPSQVQPWAALLCWAFLVHRLLTATLRVTGFHLLVLCFALWFMLYVSEPGSVGLDYYLRRSASFVICWAILVAATYVSPSLLWRVLAFTLPLWTMFALLGFVSKGAYLAVTRPLVPTASGIIGGRGATSLAPEATDFGFTMAFMLLLTLVTRKALSRDGAVVPVWPVGLALFNVLLSQSGSGFFAVMVLGGLWYLTQRTAGRGRLWPRYLVVGLMVLAALFLIGTIPETGIRGVDLILLTLRSPTGLLDTTLSYRIVQNAVGILGMMDSHGLGYGAGAFLKLGGAIYARHDLGAFFGLTGYYATSVPLSFDGSPLAYFPVLFLEYGLIGLTFAVLLFRTVALSGISFRPLCLAMMFMTWVQSFPAAYPPFWLLIGLALNPGFWIAPARQGGVA
ncbi:hypothetical protein SOM26_09860 [Sphingomonas sp. CFBP8993]|nr:hypothetical protein [Sphingomonas sp. CFBP8993]